MRRLPCLKIHFSRSGDLSDLFSGFFKTGGKNFEDVGLTFPQGFEQIDIFIKSRMQRGSEGVPGQFRLSVGDPDLLGAGERGQA